jgi:hypothetical protein
MSRVEKKKKKKAKPFKSIFDNKDTSCIAAVNYFRAGKRTQILWLATTLSAPPIESIHVIWRKLGLATYLVCLLLKQHTGIGTGSLDDSCLSLQASSKRGLPVRSFYLKLGFISDDLEDNGLSITSQEFQEQVQVFPKVWVSSDKERMSFLHLSQGRLNLSETGVFDLTQSNSEIILTWQKYGYAQFPFSSPSMKRIESYLDTRPILRWLSIERLPLTDRPLTPRRSLCSLSGKILGSARVSLKPHTWLQTDEILFLFAFLMRNKENNNGFVHVLGPAITDKISKVYKLFRTMRQGSATEKEAQTYNYNLEGIQDYIEASLDILENKFLVFLCNVNNMHWISVVVINPFLVYDRHTLPQDDEECDDGRSCFVDNEELAGWCVFNSNPSDGDTKHAGFQGTCFSKNRASYGVRLFLNICASYLKSKKEKGGNGRDPGIFSYEEPFGNVENPKGTDEFPRLDYESPSIIMQETSYDCSLAAVANSIAFIVHNRDVKFLQSKMERCTPQEPNSSHMRGLVGFAEVRYLLKEKHFGLKPFWDRVMSDAGNTRHGKFADSTSLLMYMRREFIEIIDEIASDSITNYELFVEVKQHIEEPTFLLEPARINEEKKEEVTRTFLPKRKAKSPPETSGSVSRCISSGDGEVSGLRYNAKEKIFVANVDYTKRNRVVREQINVSHDWVTDTYGNDIAMKLMDHELDGEFIKPLNEQGALVTMKLDERKVIKLKYLPPTYIHGTDSHGNDQVTDEIRTNGVWKGLLEDGTVTTINEEFVTQSFGTRFVVQCKSLGSQKFLRIPAGSCRSSVMTIIPALMLKNAPPIKYMQGDIDSCVFSSLASAFHQTGIPDLVRVASLLQDKCNGLSGGADCLQAAMQIVASNVSWLQPKRMDPKSFRWEEDINDNMFVVAVMQDSTGSCQHAITIFRNWIYDSNEPFALPLSKESLDCCTWSTKDGAIEDPSMFVCFANGWIFKENETKKKKVLDTCV